MRTIMPELSRWEKRRLRIWIQRETDAGTRTRMLMLLQVSKGKPVAEAAEALHVARSTVYRLLDRFQERCWSERPTTAPARRSPPRSTGWATGRSTSTARAKRPSTRWPTPPTSTPPSTARPSSTTARGTCPSTKKAGSMSMTSTIG